MTNKNIICIRCGKVQPNSDFLMSMDTKYIILEKNFFCPKCRNQTEQIATGEITSLIEQLEKDPSGPLDSYVIKLVKR